MTYKHQIESVRKQLAGVRQILQEQLLLKKPHAMDPEQLQLFTGQARVAASLQLAVDEKPRLWCSGSVGSSLQHEISHKLDYSEFKSPV